MVAAAAAEVLVVTKALAAIPFAARAEPALKPNHPNHSSAAPMTVVGMLCGSMGSVPNPRRAPMTRATARAETPAVMCTTIPPAKSRAPIWASHPPPQTQWATGS